MKQIISCHKGKCYEAKGKTAKFNDLFENKDFVSDIERDLWKNNFYGS